MKAAAEFVGKQKIQKFPIIEKYRAQQHLIIEKDNNFFNSDIWERSGLSVTRSPNWKGGLIGEIE